eukprot:161081_1
MQSIWTHSYSPIFTVIYLQCVSLIESQYSLICVPVNSSEMVIKGAGYIKVATVRYVLRLICGYPEHKSWTHDGKQVIKDIFSNKTWMSMYQCVMTERYGDDFVAYYKASLTSGTYFYGLRFTNSVLWKSSQFIEQIKNDDLKFARKLKKTKNKTEEQLIIELITRKCRYSDIARSTYYKLKPHEFIARQQKKKKKRKKNTNDTKETTEIKKPETKPTVTYSNSATSSNSISYTSSSQPFINPDSYAQSEVTQGTHSNYNTPYHPPFMHQHPDAAFYEAFYHFHLQKEKNGMMNHQNDVNHQNENIPSPMFDETQTNDITIESNFYENSNVSPPNEETMQNSMIHNLSISIDNDDTMPNSMENEDTMANEEAMQNSMIHNLSISIDNDDTMPNSMENEDTMANEEAMQNSMIHNLSISIDNDDTMPNSM